MSKRCYKQIANAPISKRYRMKRGKVNDMGNIQWGHRRGEMDWNLV